MACYRRLIPLRSSLLVPYPPLKGFGGSCKSYNSIVSSDQRVLKFEDEVNQLLKSSNTALKDKVAELRCEFQAAKQSFFKIPDALKAMPKMNPEGIYVNKNLRLDNIQVYGFDYDYTLANYSAALQTLIYDLAKEHLVNECRYPDSCMEFKYDHTFPIRGLYYDKSKGCLLKLDFFGSIEPDGCFFGRRKLTAAICQNSRKPLKQNRAATILQHHHLNFFTEKFCTPALSSKV
ncbi:unnamed protein product [Ilex paraguariensis]|uniref:5'-nucleotidase domain-containing protein n=1 Tax=Ilex paraguariensis TaxID=185542 RepID=A0ABC8TV52_9AQUA